MRQKLLPGNGDCYGLLAGIDYQALGLTIRGWSTQKTFHTVQWRTAPNWRYEV
eukprot:COSAG01_NODE_3037_length_6685_cov_3.846341_1_plen_53_part_00